MGVYSIVNTRVCSLGFTVRSSVPFILGAATLEGRFLSIAVGRLAIWEDRGVVVRAVGALSPRSLLAQAVPPGLVDGLQMPLFWLHFGKRFMMILCDVKHAAMQSTSVSFVPDLLRCFSGFFAVITGLHFEPTSPSEQWQTPLPRPPAALREGAPGSCRRLVSALFS